MVEYSWWLTLNDISTFSPPQISILSSYVPMCSKYFFEIEKRPPAKVGVLKFSQTHKIFRYLNDWGGPLWNQHNHHFLLYRIGFVLAQPLCILGYRLPTKSQAPVKVASVVGAAGGRRLVELKGVEVNGGDLWTDHSSGFFNNAGQQRFEPTMETLAYKRQRWRILYISFLNTITSSYCQQTPSVSQSHSHSLASREGLCYIQQMVYGRSDNYFPSVFAEMRKETIASKKVKK